MDKRGGKRVGAGAPYKYGEVLIPITIKVPTSKKKIILLEIKELLKKYEQKEKK